jgi:hypothetical protein
LLSSISRQGRLILNIQSRSPILEPIEQLQREFDQFRSTRPRRTRLPEPLWQSAMELARQYGLYSVAHPLRLDYTQLKKRLGGVAGLPKKVPAPAFVELIASHPATVSEFLIEFESSRWGKMRIQWKGSAPPDWSSLLRAWRESER